MNIRRSHRVGTQVRVFAPWPFRPQQKSVRSIIEVTSLHTEFTSLHDIIKVHLTSKYFFRLNKPLYPFETHCSFLPCFNPNLDLLQAVKVTKSGYQLSHDRASKGYGSIPGLKSQTSLHACSQKVHTMQISP